MLLGHVRHGTQRIDVAGFRGAGYADDGHYAISLPLQAGLLPGQCVHSNSVMRVGFYRNQLTAADTKYVSGLVERIVTAFRYQDYQSPIAVVLQTGCQSLLGQACKTLARLQYIIAGRPQGCQIRNSSA